MRIKRNMRLPSYNYWHWKIERLKYNLNNNKINQV
jgi:hypothetical protein